MLMHFSAMQSDYLFQVKHIGFKKTMIMNTEIYGYAKSLPTKRLSTRSDDRFHAAMCSHCVLT